MKRPVKCFIVVAALNIFSAAAQKPTGADKVLAKADKLVDKYKYDQAEEILQDAIDDDPTNPDLWNKMADVSFYDYNNALNTNNLFNNMSITVTDSSGATITNDTLAQHFMQLMQDMTPAGKAKLELIDRCRTACLRTRGAEEASTIIRRLLIDEPVDTNINKQAQDYFDQAEAAFGQGDYNQAANFYKKAIGADSSYYQARLYLGDAYYFLKDYVDAAKSFANAAQQMPHALEPYKYLADAYEHIGNIDLALATTVQALMIYPDLGMGIRLKRYAAYKGKDLTGYWVQRGVFPNAVGADAEPVASSSPWYYYQNALQGAKPFINEQGIFVPDNSLTTEKYLESYSWEEMLKHTTDTQFDIARSMQQKGFLDCYALITNFHYDVYDQYADLIANHKEKVQQYFDLLLK